MKLNICNKILLQWKKNIVYCSVVHPFEWERTYFCYLFLYFCCLIHVLDVERYRSFIFFYHHMYVYGCIHFLIIKKESLNRAFFRNIYIFLAIIQYMYGKNFTWIKTYLNKCMINFSITCIYLFFKKKILLLCTRLDGLFKLKNENVEVIFLL